MSGTEFASPPNVDIRRAQPGLAWISEGPYSAAVTFEVLAGALRVRVATVRRWIHAGRLPALIADRCRTLFLGLLEHPRWRGWHVDDEGRLWAPNGHGFMPGELEHVGLYRQAAAAWRAIAEELKAELAAERLRAGVAIAGVVRRFGHPIVLEPLNQAERATDDVVVRLDELRERRAKFALRRADVGEKAERHEDDGGRGR